VAKDGFSAKERKDWLAHDETFSTPLGNDFEDREINSFEDLGKDDTPYNPYDREGKFKRVGTGEVTNPDTCGKWRGFLGCLNVDLHDLVTLDGHNFKGKVHIEKRFFTCSKPSCPVCYASGWAVREAGNVRDRINEASKRFGLAEHSVASVPPKDYCLPYAKLRSKVVKVLRSRYIHGGFVIFHAQRYANFWEAKKKGVPCGWYFSPHFHVLGFVDGGYSKCRRCPKVKKAGYTGKGVCEGCSGFEANTRRLYEKDGWIVEVMSGKVVNGKKIGREGRISVFGTAWYQLNHASIVSGSKRDHVGFWFGTCSYRKLKLRKEDRIERRKCPICGNDLKPVRCAGGHFAEILSRWWEREFEDDYLNKDGSPNWVPAPTSR